MPLRVCLFGHTGQVATELRRRAGQGLTIASLGRDAVDLAKPETCVAAIESADADVIVNAAAYTDVDKAEEEEALAMRINADAVGAMARAAAARGLPFLHISTDYVFDGSVDQPLDEMAPTEPLGAYGRSKLAGEHAVANAAGNYAILRTSWVFSAHGRNFVKSMLRVASERNLIRVVDDQWGNPTAAFDVADALLTMAHAFHDGRGVNGLFHFGGNPSINWYGFTKEIFSQFALTKDIEVVPIPATEWPSVANRPAYAALNCDRIKRHYGIEQPNWTQSLAAVLDELRCHS